MDIATGGFGGEATTEFAIGGDSTSDEDAGGTERFLSGEGLSDQVTHDGVLEAGDEVERLRVAGCERGLESGFGRSVGAGVERFAAGLGLGAEVMELDVAENGGLDSRKREEEVRVEVGDRGGFGGLGAWRNH